jgi:hypothetical protein
MTEFVPAIIVSAKGEGRLRSEAELALLDLALRLEQERDDAYRGIEQRDARMDGIRREARNEGIEAAALYLDITYVAEDDPDIIHAIRALKDKQPWPKE